jgi:hypothetical protein
MFNGRLFFCALGPFLGMPVLAQPVISARAGLIHLCEGAVLLDGQAIEQRSGKFEQMRDGSELRTRDGRAEVLLAPGVFLRIGEDSAIRMISNRLVDTRLEFLTGSLILDAGEASLKAPITLVYQEYQVRIQRHGRYRFNAMPAELRVESGEAEVLLDSRSAAVTAGYVLPFSTRLEARRVDIGTMDRLDQWDNARSGAIAENNLDAAQTTDLAGVLDTWQNASDAALQALGMSSYLPPAGYAPLSNYTTFLSSPTGMSLLTPLGIRVGSTFGLYPVPLFRYNPLRPAPPAGAGYRNPAHFPTAIGTYRSPIYSGAPARVGTPAPGAAVHPVHPVGHR